MLKFSLSACLLIASVLIAPFSTRAQVGSSALENPPSPEPQVEPDPQQQTCQEEAAAAWTHCEEQTQPNTPDRVDCIIQQLEYRVLYCPCREDNSPPECNFASCENVLTFCYLGVERERRVCLLQEDADRALCRDLSLRERAVCEQRYGECKNPPRRLQILEPALDLA